MTIFWVVIILVNVGRYHSVVVTPVSAADTNSRRCQLVR
jgi:hypothetical protein